MKVRRHALNLLNLLLGVGKIELVRQGRRFGDYIPFRKTISNAKETGLSVGDYIDRRYNVPGATQETINNLEALGVFSFKIDRVCEIGPGSGRYLEKTINLCQPNYYEIYETAYEWRKWLSKNYKVTAHIPTGSSLDRTPSQSIDLIQSHKVFPGLPVLTICQYFNEMARVVRHDGKVIFDILSEECLEDGILDKWITSKITYPCSMIAKDFAINFFTNRNFSFIGSFFIPMKPGVTQYLVFSK